MLRGVAGRSQNRHKAAAFGAVPRFLLPSAARFGFNRRVARVGLAKASLVRPHIEQGPVSLDRSIADLTTAGMIPAAAALGLLNLLLIGP
jgi:ABC-type tungstate transport system substrate-binding protein